MLCRSAAPWRVVIGLMILLLMGGGNAALADSTGAYDNSAAPRQGNWGSDSSPSDNNQKLLNNDWKENESGEPMEDSDKTPDEANNDSLMKSNSGDADGSAELREKYSFDPPPEDTPTAGYKMIILDDKGNTTQIKTSGQ